MAFGKWEAVIEELREQREESQRAWAEQRKSGEREWALVRHEQQLTRRQLEQGELRLEREFQLNRRAYEEGMALCARLIERHGEALNDFTRVMTELRADVRAQTNAVFKLIDRIDLLEGGAA